MNVRHRQCIEERTEVRFHPAPVPDFEKLHAEMQKTLKNAPHKTTTVPKPFHLSDPKPLHHRQCTSSSPPLWRARDVRRTSTEDVVIRPTHSSIIRMEAIRKRQEKLYEERHQSEKFWEEKKEEMDFSRLKLLSSMGSRINVAEEIEKKTAEKKKHIAETTRDYEHYLAEMQQRVIERPLIMERQSIIAQKQKFTRKYEQRMADVEKAYGSGSFESDEELNDDKKPSKSSKSSSFSSESGSSSERSTSKRGSGSNASSKRSSHND
ncbi:unnamed protein product [Heligmosomoides polygyrus]|uniref:DUF2040 domain-containing protein n=1 Tax=Heligmosomoides polygyrus TaxID=6339 RepID=A0A3P8ALV4_HELPZ|nr:unnamed protein product [Heligmosomoides polygyrus]